MPDEPVSRVDWVRRVRQALAAAPYPPEDDVVEELAQHASTAFETAQASGATVDEAEQRVQTLLDQWAREAPTLRHRTRRPPIPPPPASHSSSWFSGMLLDCRYALRLLRRQPRFAALVILTLTLGIGATTALFSVTYGVLIKPLPFPPGDRLVVLKETRGGRLPGFGSFSNAAYLAWREQAQTIEEIAGWTPRSATITGAGDPERIRAANVTASLFRAIGARPIRGALFTDAEETAPVIVISEGLWRRRFGADERAIGSAIQVDGESRTIIGVLPDQASYPDRQTRAWLPFHVQPATGNLLAMFEAIATLRSGFSIEQMTAEGTARGRFAVPTGMTTNAIFGGDGPVGVSARTLTESLTGDVRRPLFVLMAAVGLLLLVGVTNVAGLQLSRATARRRELAIRAAIGASSGRVIRQLLIESSVLGLVGGAGGF